METINGEWIMKGLDLDDPAAIHTVEECRSLIHTLGFLPLFSNAITGFSVEEHVPSVQWWTDDSQTDPWLWRQLLAEEETIAYGKFFGRTAGFISKDFFPTFANYRRNGYDFDALFEDELASYRAKKIMDVFCLNDEAVGKQILSSEIKVLAGFYKDGGEKNFEGTITDLQMQTYLIFSRFEQKQNKKGQPYGWYLGVMETPETKWGRNFVTSEYTDDPMISWKKIRTRMKKFFKEAADEDIMKLLGIKYPGAENKPTGRSRKTISLPWPENLLRELEASAVKAAGKRKEETNEFSKCEIEDVSSENHNTFVLPDHLTSDQLSGLNTAILTLKDNEQKVLRLRFEEYRTIKETADEFGVTGSRIQQIKEKALRKLLQPARIALIMEGLERFREKTERNITDIQVKNKREQEQLLRQVEIMESGLSVRACNCLIRNGMSTLADVVKLVDEKPKALLKFRNLGMETALEIIEKLEEYGVDCNKSRKVYGFGIERREDIAELEPSVRLYNILKREGLDTVSKIINLIEKDPKALYRIEGMGKKTFRELMEKLEAENFRRNRE